MRSGINLLDETDILKVARSCTTVRVRLGEELIRKNDTSEELYIVTDGSFKVYDDSYGEDFVHAILTKGAIFGEMSFLDATPRSASVKAISDGSLLRMGRKEFDSLLVNNPDTALLFLFTLARVVTRRLREVNDALRGMTFSVGDSDSKKAIGEVIAQMEYAVHIEVTGSQKGRKEE
ncbi:MAG: cyclic nucleotide-binding domain-containing protein [Candidatus Fermentibacteraceae bacterium]|nr:cyclic nucleotide-binding domain-containing protein [Candidatus Fermentibacteraceae bacterium]